MNDKPLDFFVVDFESILKDVKIECVDSHIKEYLEGGRQDILENIDLFCENVRSVDKPFKQFELFNKIDSINSDTIIVISLYLELLQYWGRHNKIKELCGYYCNKYPNNKIVVHWNHDTDAKQIFNFIDDYKNLYVLNFNTSLNHERFIILPFWCINDSFVEASKTKFANLICSLNNELRYELYNTLNGDPNFYVSQRVEYSEYENVLSSSVFTFCPKGVGLSSYRFFECFHLNTIPILIADDVILPFEKDLDYKNFIVKIPENKILDLNYIKNILSQINQNEFLDKIKEVKEFFTLKGAQKEIYKKLK
jgi:hypothetical protein